MAPAVTPDVHPENPNAELQGYPPPVVMPLPAAAPAAALEPGLACTPSADISDAPPTVAEEPSSESALVPATQEKLPLEETPGLAQRLLSLKEEALRTLTKLSDLFYFIVEFWFSPRCTLLLYFITFLLWGSFLGAAFIIFFFKFLALIFLI